MSHIRKLFFLLFALQFSTVSANESRLWESWEEFNGSLLGNTFFVNCYWNGDKTWTPRSFKLTKTVLGRKKLHKLVQNNWIPVDSTFQDTAIDMKTSVDLTLDSLRHPELSKPNAFYSARVEFEKDCNNDLHKKYGYSFIDESVFKNVSEECARQPVEKIFGVAGVKSTSLTLSFIRGTLTETFEPNDYTLYVRKQCESSKPWKCDWEEDKPNTLPDYSKYSTEGNNIDFSNRSSWNTGRLVVETGNLEKRSELYECEKVR